jgi:hypothetical protein
MAKDEREEEREFLDGLKARTGRDLAEWMSAIAARGFSDKNEIIDWLRSQGLTFARASWLERIHRSGGAPIHASASGGDLAMETRGEESRPTEPRRPAHLRIVPKAADKDVLEVAEKQEKDEPPTDAAAAIEKLVAAGKGYRPLYHLLEARIRRAIPHVRFSAQARHVSVGAPREFAAVTLQATEVRLGLDLGDRTFDGTLQKAKLRGPGPAITHMIVLTDARQADDDLLALIAAANSRVNPGSADSG